MGDLEMVGMVQEFALKPFFFFFFLCRGLSTLLFRYFQISPSGGVFPPNAFLSMLLSFHGITQNGLEYKMERALGGPSSNC
jgi:hypothetical protein